MGDITGGLAVAAFLAVVANKLIEGLVAPLWDKAQLDRFYLLYVSWVVGALLVWLSGVNLFKDTIMSWQIGQALTAIVAGGGASFLHDIFDVGDEPVDDEIPF